MLKAIVVGTVCACWCSVLTLVQDPPPPDIQFSGSDHLTKPFIDCANALIDKQGTPRAVRLTDGKKYLIREASQKECEEVGSKGGFSKYSQNGKVTLPAASGAAGDWDGVIGISVVQTVTVIGKGKLKVSGMSPDQLYKFDDPKFEPGHSSDYVCGLVTGVLIHEEAHEGVVKDLLACIAGLDPPPSPPVTEDSLRDSDCAEVLAKIRTVRALNALIEQLQEELAAEEAANPQDQDKIDELEAKIAGLQDALNAEIDDLNKVVEDGPPVKTQGEKMLEDCPAACVNSPGFPITDPGSIPDPIPSPQ